MNLVDTLQEIGRNIDVLRKAIVSHKKDGLYVMRDNIIVPAEGVLDKAAWADDETYGEANTLLTSIVASNKVYLEIYGDKAQLTMVTRNLFSNTPHRRFLELFYTTGDDINYTLKNNVKLTDSFVNAQKQFKNIMFKSKAMTVIKHGHEIELGAASLDKLNLFKPVIQIGDKTFGMNAFNILPYTFLKMGSGAMLITPPLQFTILNNAFNNDPVDLEVYFTKADSIPESDQSLYEIFMEEGAIAPPRNMNGFITEN